MIRKTRDFSFEIKAAEKGGFFNGHASVFDVTDSYDEVVKRGAFVDTIAEAKGKGRKFPILWQHKSDEPLGAYDVIREDGRGLYVEGRLLTDTVARAAEAHSLLKESVVSGLSIGFLTRESSYDEKTGIRSLTKLDLFEISLVSFPANDESRTISVRRKLDAGNLPSISEFEKHLRESGGFSRKQAAAIASAGYRQFLSESGSDADVTAVEHLLKKMRGFKISK